jgi:hypothetical protein
MRHALSENYKALVVNPHASTVDGYAGREAAQRILTDVAESTTARKTLTAGADQGNHAAEHVKARNALEWASLVERNVKRPRCPPVSESNTTTDSCATSQQKRKRIEMVFRWSNRRGPS